MRRVSIQDVLLLLMSHLPPVFTAAFITSLDMPSAEIAASQCCLRVSYILLLLLIFFLIGVITLDIVIAILSFLPPLIPATLHPLLLLESCLQNKIPSTAVITSPKPPPPPPLSLSLSLSLPLPLPMCI